MNSRILSVMVVVLLGCIGLAVLGYVLLAPRDPEGPPPGFEVPDFNKKGADPGGGNYDTKRYDLATDKDAERTIREVRSKPFPAFKPSHPPTAAETAEFGPFFDRLLTGAKTGSEDGDAVYSCFEYRRYFEERIRLWAASRGGEPIPMPLRERWGTEFRSEIMTRFIANKGKGLGDEAAVVRVAASTDGRVAMVAVRLTAADRPAPQVWLWRLGRFRGEWQAFDFAPPGRWLWYTAEMADADLGLTDVGGQPAKDVDALTTAVVLAGEKDTADRLDQVLARFRDKRLPPPLAAWRAYAEGQLRFTKGQTAEAVPFFDEAVKADPTWPPAFAARAAAFNKLGKYEPALADAKAADALVGPWVYSVLQQVAALRGLGKMSEAREVLKAASELFPADEKLKAIK